MGHVMSAGEDMDIFTDINAGITLENVA